MVFNRMTYWPMPPSDIARKRQKVVTVPVCLNLGKIKYLVVRDRKSGEWTFPTGGVRQVELNNPLTSAIRELYEETSGIINPTDGDYSYYSFKTGLVTRGMNMKYVYHTYIINMEFTPLEQVLHRSMYNMKENIETCDMQWVTMNEMQHLNMWDIMAHFVRDNPDFHFSTLMVF